MRSRKNGQALKSWKAKDARPMLSTLCLMLGCGHELNIHIYRIITSYFLRLMRSNLDSDEIALLSFIYKVLIKLVPNVVANNGFAPDHVVSFHSTCFSVERGLVMKDRLFIPRFLNCLNLRLRNAIAVRDFLVTNARDGLFVTGSFVARYMNKLKLATVAADKVKGVNLRSVFRKTCFSEAGSPIFMVSQNAIDPIRAMGIVGAIDFPTMMIIVDSHGIRETVVTNFTTMSRHYLNVSEMSMQTVRDLNIHYSHASFNVMTIVIVQSHHLPAIDELFGVLMHFNYDFQLRNELQLESCIKITSDLPVSDVFKRIGKDKGSLYFGCPNLECCQRSRYLPDISNGVSSASMVNVAWGGLRFHMNKYQTIVSYGISPGCRECAIDFGIYFEYSMVEEIFKWQRRLMTGKVEKLPCNLTKDMYIGAIPNSFRMAWRLFLSCDVEKVARMADVQINQRKSQWDVFFLVANLVKRQKNGNGPEMDDGPSG